MSYDPHLEDCVSCRREWKEGDKVFAYYEDYMCEDCEKDLGRRLTVAFESYPASLIAERIKEKTEK